MGDFKIRHLLEKPSGFYFQPSKAMSLGGFRAEPLGKDMASAVARVVELNSQWDAIRSGEDNASPALPVLGTMDRLIYDLKLSPTFLKRSAGRQKNIEETTKIISPIFGPSRVASIRLEQIEQFQAALLSKGSVHKTWKVMKDLKFLFKRAMKLRWITYNPCDYIEVELPEPRAVRWKEGQPEQAIERAWDEGFHGLSVGIEIMYDIGQSPGDIYTLVMDQIGSDGRVYKNRGKTSKPFNNTLQPKTLARIKAYHKLIGIMPMPSALIIRTRRGVPYNKDTFSKDFRKIREMLGWPKNIQLIDIRRTVTSEEAAGGATESEIAAGRAWSHKTAAKNMDTYIPLNAELANNARDKRFKNKKGAKV